MQNKGAIVFLAVVLSLICVWELHFTFVTQHFENQAKIYANNDQDKENNYLDSLKNENIWLGVFNYKDIKTKEINFGLDLQGGMNLILEVSVKDLLKALSNDNHDSIFLAAINMAEQKQMNSNSDYLTLFSQSFEEIAPGASLSTIFSTFELRDKIKRGMTNAEVVSKLRIELDDAISNAENVIRTRIDQFGVVQPNIQRLETQGRFVVDLPGVDDPERVKKVLQTTAQLEFWNTYENSDDDYIFQRYLMDADAVLKDILDEEKETQDSLKILNDSSSTIIISENTEAKETNSDKTDVKDKIQDKNDIEFSELLNDLEVNDTIKTDTNIIADKNKEHPLLSLLNQYPQQGSVVGLARGTDIKKINQYLSYKEIQAVFPRDVKLLWGNKPRQITGQDGQQYELFELYALKDEDMDGKPTLTGDVIVDAREQFGSNKASAQVSMSMNAEGAIEWARMTTEAANPGSNKVNRCIAIVLDNHVYSSPVVRGAITGGHSEISGNFTIEEATDLANVLKSGKMPAKVVISQSTVVGPSLGKEAITSGLNSFLIAFFVVLLYMIFYYSRSAGLIADIALIINMFFIIGVLASLRATLTLPGIAGIVLTIGMAVDANVIIYERIKEELFAGKGLRLAVNDGYKNSMSSIIDANITTLLTGIILYVFGVGPIKGFATTLIIGIITSLFSAMLISRLIFLKMLDKNMKFKFSTKITQNAFKNLQIKFIEKRKFFYVLSSILILIGIGSLFVRGLNPGIDFTGGRSYVVKFEQTADIVEIQNLLKVQFNEAPQVITYGSDNQVRITTKYKITDKSADVDDEIDTKMYTGLNSIIGEDVTIEDFNKNYLESSQKVGPSIAHNIKSKSIWTVLFSFIVIFLYILLRFRNWQFGLGAITALMHDVLLVLGSFSLLYGFLPFSMEMDQAFIAAILTVVGYSINDTVVIFDRIREFVGLYPKRERKEIMNHALNSTLSRTFSTSASTFFVLLVIFLFGGESIKGFTFALLVGVVVGTYSSLFIASPIVYDFIKKDENARVLKAKKK